MVLVMGIATVFAQSNKEEIDLMQAAFGMEKKAVVQYFVEPGEADKDAFWTLYDEYETERKELGKERIDLLTDYADNYQKMTNEHADEWMTKVISLQGRTDKLLTKYFKKVKKETNPILATKFYQIEGFILTSIRMEVLSEIPFLK